MATPPSVARGFWLLWSAQVISLLGSGLTTFGLAVYVYQGTGSVLKFGTVAATAIIPQILMGPLSGVAADRKSRKAILLAANFLGIAVLLFLSIMASRGHLAISVIYPCTLLLGVVTVIQEPALSASIPLLVPDEKLGNANGLVEIAQAGAQVVSPVAAGLVLGAFGLRPILAVDLTSFALAALLIGMVRIPRSRPEAAEESTVLKDLAAGFAYLRSETGLMTLIGVFVLANFFIAMAEVALQPMILSFTDSRTLGVVLSVGGAGYVVGGLVMSKWGGPDKKVTAALGFMALEGVALFLAGLRPSVAMVAVSVFLLFAALPIESACTLTVFQRKVPDELRGRVLALATTLSTLALPLGYFAAGPLADDLLNPLLRHGGALSSSLGPVFGTAQGRGIGLLMSCIGLIFVVICLLAPRNRHLKVLDTETMENLLGESRIAAAEDVPV